MNREFVENQDTPLTRRFPSLVFVATFAAATGSTLATQVIENALARENFEFDLYSLESFAIRRNSKLKSVLPRTQDLPFGASFAEAANDPNTSFKRFENILDHMCRSGAVFDFGADVAMSFFVWASLRAEVPLHGKLPPITLVVPVIYDRVSIGAVINLIKDARKSLKILPIAKIIVVHNERQGPFTDFLDTFADLKAMEVDQSHGIVMTSIRLPKINSEVWQRVQSMDIPFAEVLKLHPRDLASLLDLPPLPCARGGRAIKEWLDAAIGNFMFAGLFA